jgi:hypothetical protein
MSEFLTTDEQNSPSLNEYPQGHPVRVYLEENILINKLVKLLHKVDLDQGFEEFNKYFDQLCKIEKHYARKENQLFPYLEKYGWTSPSQNMWAMHDTVRDSVRDIKKALKTDDVINVKNSSITLLETINHIMLVEEQRLFPRAMDMLNEDDWKEMREGDEEIGWMFDTPPVQYPEVEYIHPTKLKKAKNLSFSIEDKTHFDEGYLNMEQVNLMLKFLPVDLTYVDENDKVIFYNRGEDRVFPRSAGIIGREVKFCHPPKSVDQVLRILEEFKKGTKDVADFWINFKGKFIHIRYFAIRDEDKNYKGVIEMTQDVTDIKKLEGEQRLLDWD